MQTTRRELLIDGLQVAGSLSLLGLARGALTGGGPGTDDTALVVVQLTGGNDGLNTVVPHRQDAYYRLRPTLSLARNTLHELDDELGLHPRMGALAELYHEGSLAVVQNVGYPNPDRSHFRSMEIWHTADVEGPRHGAVSDVGWLGRVCDQVRSQRPDALGGLHVGSSDLPLALQGERVDPPAVIDTKSLHVTGSPGYARLRSKLLEQPNGHDPRSHLHMVAAESYRVSERLTQVLERSARGAYPEHTLAQRLELVARLIEAGFGLRVFHVELSGFDTHARQATTHAELLGALSESLAAFQRDLAHRGLARRVVTLVFSEFGRRVAENGSKGTDHGAAAPLFLLGQSVRSGVHGTSPDLTALAEGDIPYSCDFRSVYTTLERGWLGLSPATELPGLDLVRT